MKILPIIDKFVTQINELTEKHHQYKNELETQSDKYETKIQELNKNCARLSNNITQHKQTISELSKIRDEQKTTNDKHDNTIKQLNENNTTLNEQNTEYKQTINQYETKIKELNENDTKQNKNITKYKDKISELSKKINELESKKEEKNDENNLTKTEKHFKEYFFKKFALFKNSTKIYYNNLIKNEANNIEILCELDKNTLKQFIGVNIFHLKPFLNKINELNNNLSEFKKYLENIKLISYRPIFMENGVYGFYQFNQKYKDVKQLNVILNNVGASRTIFDFNPTKNINNNNNNNDNNGVNIAAFAEQEAEGNNNDSTKLL